VKAAVETRQQTAGTTTVQLVEAAEVPMEEPEAGVQKGEGQLLLGAAAQGQPVQLVGAVSAASAASVAEGAWVFHSHTLWLGCV
jgi:hypothetical protein